MIKLSAILLLASFPVFSDDFKKNDISLECVNSLQSLLSSITTISGSFKQVTISKFSSDISKNPSLLLIGNINDIELSFSTGCKSGKAVDFTLTPISADSLYEKIQVSFTGKTPSSMSLQDSLGRKTIINLEEVQTNNVVSQKNFQFIPPDGVDIIWYK